MSGATTFTTAVQAAQLTDALTMAIDALDERVAAWKEEISKRDDYEDGKAALTLLHEERRRYRAMLAAYNPVAGRKT